MMTDAGQGGQNGVAPMAVETPESKDLPQSPKTDLRSWKTREEELRQTSRLLRAIGRVNKLIIGAREGDEILRRSCRILKEIGGYRSVQAVALPSNGGPRRVFGKGPLTENRGLPGCARRVLENGQSLFVPDPPESFWCRACPTTCLGWTACFLLGSDGRTHGLLHVASTRRPFDQSREVAFLEETAGNLGYALESLQERAARDRMVAEVRALKEFNENIVCSLNEGIIIENPKGRITFVNPTLERLLGTEPGELLGRHWRTIVDPTEIKGITAKTRRRTTATQDKYESVLKAKDGARIPVLVAAQSIFANGRFQGVLTAITDIRDLKEAERRLLETQKQLYELATKDGLTGLWNRASILKFLEEELEHGRRERYPTSVIMIDLDHFKKINDAHGHLVGDRVFRAMAAAIQTRLRPYDRVGRYGGDEVLLVLPHGSTRKAAAIAERLRRACARSVLRVRGGQVRFTLSLGCASSESYARPSVERLIRAADRALYTAKKLGRNRVAPAP